MSVAADELDRWTRVLPLGVGAFGQVHLAWDTAASSWVAVKEFTGRDELGLLRFVIESRIRVEHPHLVRTLAFRLVDDRAWLVTQLARGGSVRQLMTRAGALPWGWVAEAVDQVLDALVALHASGVVHRDLKPANLLLRDAGAGRPHLLVGDFGIATWRTVSMTGIGAAIGTPGYLAPEYLDGHQPSPSTDVFAVGVLAAELLAGRRLVHHSNASPGIPADWSDVLPLPADVPTQLAAVLRRMADPDPRRRYVDCAQAREALLAAAPPEVRVGVAGVEAPDLLAGLPMGWTTEGPPEPDPTPATQLLEADGSPTTHVLSAATPPAASPTTGSPAIPPNHDPAPVTNAPTPPAAQPTTPAAGNPTVLAAGNPPATPAAGNPTTPAAGNPTTPPATPPATPAAGNPATPPSHHPAPVTNTPTPPTAQPTTPAAGNPTTLPPGPAKSRRPRRRRARRAAVLVLLLLLAAAAGTLWWAATHRTVAGNALPAGAVTSDGAPDDTPVVRWTPVLVERCTVVELARERDGADGLERCQRVPDRGQYWVEEPPAGFPKSDPGGPFPAEPCTHDTDTAYTPVGDRVVCTAGTWRVTT